MITRIIFRWVHSILHKVVVVCKMMQTSSKADRATATMWRRRWLTLSLWSKKIALFKIKMPFNCGNKVQSCLFNFMCIFMHWLNKHMALHTQQLKPVIIIINIIFSTTEKPQPNVWIVWKNDYEQCKISHAMNWSKAMEEAKNSLYSFAVLFFSFVRIKEIMISIEFGWIRGMYIAYHIWSIWFVNPNNGFTHARERAATFKYNHF